MKVLWITNILLPEAVSLLTGKGELKGSGGWMIGAANALLKTGEVSLSVAAPTPLVKELKILKGEQITYYAIPMGKGNHKYNPDFEPYWKEVKKLVEPDIVHIHGTEFCHGLAYVKACGNENVVASIQGLTSCYYYYYYGVSNKDIIKNLTVADVLLHSSLYDGERDLKVCGESEKKLIESLNHIIGRTTWDKTHAWAFNPNINYHFCNETLRPEFYSDKWEQEKCKPYTIFVSQPKNSVKGFHQLLKAMPLILREFPDTRVRIPGRMDLFPKSIKHKMLQSGYNKYLCGLIRKNNLKDHLEFLGPLSAVEMKREFLDANAFVSCSTIENSPNSVGEAQIIGTPCISSFVGGVDDMVKHRETGFLYRFDEIEMLAYYVCKVFRGDYDAESLSRQEREAALLRHDATTNCNQLLSIYKQIISE